MNLVALLASGSVVVEVVEVTTQALVEDSRATKSKRAVRAGRPASGVDGSSLSRAVELELVVGGNVTSAVLGVGEDAVLQSDLELAGIGLLPLFVIVSMVSIIVGNSRCTNLVERALGVSGRNVGDLDLEVAVVARRAARGCRFIGLDLLSDALSDRRGNDSGREDNGGSDSVAHIGGG